MRFKTVARFENYEVVEPTEPVKRIEVIDIRRQPVEQIPDKQYKRKTNKKKVNHISNLCWCNYRFICRMDVRNMAHIWILRKRVKDYEEL